MFRVLASGQVAVVVEHHHGPLDFPGFSISCCCPVLTVIGYYSWNLL